MAERPIIFSAPMVRAILAGTKTQTRRIVKTDYTGDLESVSSAEEFAGTSPYPLAVDRSDACVYFRRPFACQVGIPKPWRVGDTLWVREAWQFAGFTEDGYPFITYRADGERKLHEDYPEEWVDKLTDTWAALSEPENYDIDKRAADRRWRPSIHLPRWAARLMLRVADVRAERLQQITEPDARAEGWDLSTKQPPVEWYRGLWDDINAARGFRWLENPWVWVVTFARI